MTQQHPLSRRETIRLAGLGLGLLPFATATAHATTGEYIVGTRSPAATRAAQRGATRVKDVLSFGRFGTAVVGRFPEAALRGLANHPGVTYIEPNGLLYATTIDSGYSWGVDRVDAEKVFTEALPPWTRGDGAHVGVIDTGIADHSDLPSLGVGWAYYDGNDVNDTPKTGFDVAVDGDGHGTHCAGIVAAQENGVNYGSDRVVGVAPEVTLHPLKALRDTGSGSYAAVSAAIKHVADKDWDVASLSLGGPLSSTLETACQYAYDRGVVLVAAAGNDGGNVANQAPAAYDTVVAVSAVDDDDELAGFSNHGKEIELAAPGVRIPSTVLNDGYAAWSGTSMACPHVSGAAAIVRAYGKATGNAMSNAATRDHLAATAEKLSGKGNVQRKYGNGLVDVEGAVAALLGGGGDPTPVEPPTIDPFTAVGSTKGNKHAVIDLAWEAQDAATVTLELFEGALDGTVLVAPTTVEASGTWTHQENFGVPGVYWARLTATNAAGTTVAERDVTL